ncbi:MAG: hypothetical protein ACOYVG_09300 [Bacteroidota bacterium]
MPFEQGRDMKFFDHGEHASRQYANLLGSLSTDSSFWQSFYAGRVGRSEVIAHGTTTPSDYYRAYQYYQIPHPLVVYATLKNGIRMEYLCIVYKRNG